MSIVLIDATSDSLTVSWPEDGVAPLPATTTTNPSNKTTSNNTNKNRTYHLHYRLYTKDDDDNSTNKYETLSNSLRTCIIRKKNLVDPNRQGFMFRVCIIYPNSSSNSTSMDESYYDWMTHTEPFYLLSVEEERYQLASPKVQYGGTNASIVIQWNAFPIETETYRHSLSSKEQSNDNDDANNNTVSYEIQMREYIGGTPWTTIVSHFTGSRSGISNSGNARQEQEQVLQVRKNNCTSIHGYQFRIRPIIMTRHDDQQQECSSSSKKTDGPTGNEESIPFTTTIPFSSPSDPPIIPLSYTTTQLALQHLLLLSSLSNNNTILSNQGGTLTKRPVQDCLGGKELILLYVSAHWCGPCRQFTPKLVQWYNSIVGYNNKNSGNTNTSFMEIVFISADHDEASFVSYYQTMPWTAIDFETDSTVREHIMSPRVLNVRGIPQLAVVCGRTGNILHTNMVGQPLQNIQSFRK